MRAAMHQADQLAMTLERMSKGWLLAASRVTARWAASHPALCLAARHDCSHCSSQQAIMLTHQRAAHGNAASATHPPHPHLSLSPPPFAHQVAGHGQPGGAGGFRAHRRQRSNGCVVASSASGHTDAAVSTAADAASNSTDHQPTVLKPVPLHKEKGVREQQFYQRLDHMRRQVQGRDGGDHTSARVCWCALAASESADTAANSSAARDSPSRQQLHLEAMRSWLTFFPRFYGTVTLSDPSAHSPHGALSHYLHLEDVTQPYARPSLLDVKIGTHSWDPFAVSKASPADMEKVRREVAKCPAQSQTGFRICGARIWKPSAPAHATSHGSSKHTGEYQCYGKHWARHVSVEDVERPFWTFFGHTQSDATLAPFAPSAAAMRSAAIVLPVYIARLQRLLLLCQTAPLWRFYASSILFSYQLHDEAQQQQSQSQPSGSVSAAVDAASHDSAVIPVAGRAELHVIDFGHAYPIELPLPANLDTLLGAAHPASTKHHVAPGPAAVGGAPCPCGLPAAALDANFIAGVTSLIQVFERMLERTRAPQKL